MHELIAQSPFYRGRRKRLILMPPYHGNGAAQNYEFLVRLQQVKSPGGPVLTPPLQRVGGAFAETAHVTVPNFVPTGGL